MKASSKRPKPASMTSFRSYRIPLFVTVSLLLSALGLWLNQPARNLLGKAMADTNAIIIVSSATDNGAGTLRQAITLANGTPGADTINFDIGSGPQTINLQSPLPAITEGVTINATTQPGFSGTPIIELNGTGAGVASGLAINASGCSVQGLVINRFSVAGIFIVGNNNTITRNFIGTNIAGTAPLPNAAGVTIANGANNVVGGTAAAARNVISGNLGAGVLITSAAANNQVQGNFIGTNAAGTSGIGNGPGVSISNAANNNLIGGSTASARNIISASQGSNVVITGASTTENFVKGNFIGTAVDGTTPLSPEGNGVLIDSNASGNTIGGTAAGEGNIIAFSPNGGVRINAGSVNNKVLGNSIFGNNQLGIDLDGDGVTLNDAGDGDSGANNLQNFPVITSASSGGDTTIQGTFNSTGLTLFRLEFFASPSCSGSGNGEGKTFIGAAEAPTDASGSANFNVDFSVPVPAGNVITATATDPTGNTSEFSECVAVVITCSITCPGNITLNANPSRCGSLVSYPAPTASMSCGVVICSPPSSTFFPVGATQVVCNTEFGLSCSFLVTVLDNTPPTIACPQNISTTTAPGRQDAIVNYAIATATDACGSVIVTCTPPPGTTFPSGTTAVNCATFDSANNVSTCVFTVTVIDNEMPLIQCPDNITMDVPAGQNSALINYPAPTVSDNFPGAVVACLPPSGSVFPLGITTVSCVATDQANNRGACNFIVTINGAATVRLVIEGGGTTIEFGSNNNPVPVRKNPAKNRNSACGLFTIQNTGFSTTTLTLGSINRTGGDVDSRRISDAKEADRYLLNELNRDGTESLISVGSIVTLKAGEQKNYCLRFNPLVPVVATSTNSLSAPLVIPDLINSRVTFIVTGGGPLILNVIARVETGLKLINPDKPRKDAVVTFSRSGNEFTATFSVFDSNADVRRARYEFLNASGAVAADAIEVDLTQVLREKNLVRGQSFSVIQQFTGADSHPEVVRVRVTVFDGESSVILSSNSVSSSARAAMIMPQIDSRAATISPPTARLKRLIGQ